jgi:hypothetical protein
MNPIRTASTIEACQPFSFLYCCFGDSVKFTFLEVRLVAVRSFSILLCRMICHSHTSILQSSIEKQRTATSRTSRKVNLTESPKQQYKNENGWQASIVEAVLIGFIKIWGYKDLLHSLLIHLYITYNQPFQLSSVATDSKLKWWKNQTSFKSLSGINNIDSWNSIVYLWWWSQLRHLLGLAYHKIPMTSFYLCKLF